MEITLGLEWVPDEEYSPAFINTAIAALLEALKDSPHPAESVELLAENFFDMPWAAQCTPPFPFQAFASKKIWGPILASDAA